VWLHRHNPADPKLENRNSKLDSRLRGNDDLGENPQMAQINAEGILKICAICGFRRPSSRSSPFVR